MPTTEHTLNDALADLLRDTRQAWRPANVVSSEDTGLLVGTNARPDILITEPTVSPVCIETEVVPAITVEAEASARLGKTLRTNGRVILSSIAVRLPARLRRFSGASLRRELSDATDFETVMYTGEDSQSSSRWPETGWLTGGVADLSILAQAASVPPAVIEQAANHLVNGVSAAAGLLGEMAQSHPGVMLEICKELRQQDDEQTRRMAATILANAFVFQDSLARGPGPLSAVLTLDEMRAAGRSKSTVLSEWEKILAVNYWPIFDIARRLLKVIPSNRAKPLIDGLTATAEKLVENRLMRSHDLTGAVFQKLIADRKFLAAYYTTPASAALLVGLAISDERPLSESEWGSADKIKALRIGDLACGTGTLISTAYQRVGQLHELAGGDAELVHPDMMATGLVGCDIFPAAAHLTASMLAGAHPTVNYQGSSIMTLAFGEQPDRTIALGSINMLDSQGDLNVLAITAMAATGVGETEAETWVNIPHRFFDLVVMNPPFVRSTGHEALKIGVPRPMFAAFSSTPAVQKLMAKETRRLTEGTSAHGNAGEASIFLVLADRKVKRGGTVALVMPLSLISGEAWEASRARLAEQYGNLIVASIAGYNDDDMSFSADTGMGECLVVGEKTGRKSSRATFVVLTARPAYPLVGSAAAEQIRRLIKGGAIRRLEDGPVGGTPIYFGDDLIGQVLDAPISTSGSWSISRIADLSLAQAAYQLSHKGRLWLPTMTKSQAVSVPVAKVSEIGQVGPYHSDINGTNANRTIRGPFVVSKARRNSTPTYPVLWSHVAARETTLEFEGEAEAQPRTGRSTAEKALVVQKTASVWATASHSHFNQNFRFNSQATAMQFTPRKTIGGRAWLSIQLASDKQEKALGKLCIG